MSGSTFKPLVPRDRHGLTPRCGTYARFCRSTHNHIAHPFKVALTPGEYEIQIERGKEYFTLRDRIVVPSKSDSIEDGSNGESLKKRFALTSVQRFVQTGLVFGGNPCSPSHCGVAQRDGGRGVKRRLPRNVLDNIVREDSRFGTFESAITGAVTVRPKDRYGVRAHLVQ